MKRIVSTFTLSLFGAVALAAVASADFGRHENGGPGVQAPTPSNQTVLYQTHPGECRDGFARGITLRAAGNVAGGGASGTINVPPQVAQNAVWARLFWVILDDQAPANTERFNGNALARVANGPVTASPCWPEVFAFSYTADVLPFLQTGVNALTNFPDSGNLGIGTNMEGATLVVVYASNAVDKEIVVLGGNDLVIVNSVDLSIPVASGPGFGAELTMIVADGQPAPDEVSWNGTTISSPDAMLGLDPGPGVGYWDTVEYGVSTGGTNTANLLSNGDCLNWVGTLFRVKRGGCVVPVAPTTWSHIKGLLQN